MTTTYLRPTNGEHVHVRPFRGRMRRGDTVDGYRIVRYEFEDGRYQRTVILVGGQIVDLADFIDDLPGNMRAETIPFPVYDGCCNVQLRGRGVID